AILTTAALATGSPSSTGDSMPGIVSLIAADTGSVPAAAMRAGGAGKAGPANLIPAACRRDVSTFSGCGSLRGNRCMGRQFNRLDFAVTRDTQPTRAPGQ